MAISDIHDRWLWVGFGVFFLLAARGFRHAITDTVRLIELPPDEGSSKKDGDELPEDKLSLKSLRTLASSPILNIRNAAASLIITRFAALPDAAEMVTNDLRSKSPEVQRRARQAVKYLQDWDEELGADLPQSPASDAIYTRWRRAFDQRRYDPTMRGQTAVDSPLSQLDALSIMNATFDSAGRASLSGWDTIPVERALDVSRDGADRRRAHRQAMVLHEGPGRINEEDIITLR